jgi:hypothetical protein
LWLGLELRTPIAERLERNPVSLAILTLIELAFYPGLMVRAPKSLAITFAGSKVVGHLVVLTCKLSARTDRVRTSKKQACKKWTLTVSAAFGDFTLIRNGPGGGRYYGELEQPLIITGEQE